MKTAFRVLPGRPGRITADGVGRAWPTIRSRCSTAASRRSRPARSCGGQFNPPHSWLYLNVKNADGGDTLWSFEGSAPPSLLQRGITGSTFEPGDTVTVSYCPMKDGRPGGGLGWARLANGTFVNPADGGCDGSVKAIEQWKVWLAAGYTSSTDAAKAK